MSEAARVAHAAASEVGLMASHMDAVVALAHAEHERLYHQSMYETEDSKAHPRQDGGATRGTARKARKAKASSFEVQENERLVTLEIQRRLEGHEAIKAARIDAASYTSSGTRITTMLLKPLQPVMIMKRR
jgi:hypothetical protein